MTNWLEDRIDLGPLGPHLPKLLLIVVLYAGAVVANRAVRKFLRRAYARRVELGGGASGLEELRRTKRQRTVLTALESLHRYLIFGAATLIAVWVLFQGAADAVFGASLVIVLVGFVFQRVLGDIVAGGLLLFEGRFGVGDFVHFNVLNVTGVVEEFGLRSTTLRTLGGDTVTVLNSSITGFTRYSKGYSEFRMRCRVSPGAGERVETLAAESASSRLPFLVGPSVLEQHDLPDVSGSVVELWAVVPPSFAWLATEHLPRAIEAGLGDDLRSPVEVWSVDDKALEAYRASILLDAQT